MYSLVSFNPATDVFSEITITIDIFLYLTLFTNVLCTGAFRPELIICAACTRCLPAPLQASSLIKSSTCAGTSLESCLAAATFTQTGLPLGSSPLSWNQVRSFRESFPQEIEVNEFLNSGGLYPTASSSTHCQQSEKLCHLHPHRHGAFVLIVTFKRVLNISLPRPHPPL